MEKTNKNLLLALASGLILGLATIIPWLNFLVFVGLIPLLNAIYNSRKKSFKDQFLLGFVAGSIYFGFVFLWLWATYPLNSFGIQNKLLAIGLIGFVYISSILDTAIFWGLFSLFSAKVSSNKKYFAINSISLFVIFEFFRSYAYGIFWAGSETLHGFHWTAGNLAYLTTWNHWVLLSASLWGIYGISALIIFINLLILFLLKSKIKNKKYFAVGIFVFVLILGVSPLPKKGEGETITISAIQTEQEPRELTSAEMLKDFSNKISLLKESSRSNPSVIVFPESSDFFKNISSFLTTKEAKDFFESLFKGQPVVIIDNSKYVDENGLSKSRTIYLDPEGGITGWYDKQLLMPIGEYAPYSMISLGNLNKKLGDTVKNLKFYSKGDNFSKPVDFQGKKIGALICSDMLSPDLSRSLSNLGANLIIYQTSESLFNGSTLLTNSNMSMAKMRSAETGRPVIVSSNSGKSFVTSGQGKTIKQSLNNGYTVVTSDIQMSDNKTLNTKMGDRPIVLILFGLFALVIFLERRKRTSKIK